MTRGVQRIVIWLVSASVLVDLGFAAEDAFRISKEKLEKLIDNPDVIILDVRYAKHWQNSKYKIKGAVRRRPTLFDSWANEFPRNKVLVLY